MFALQRNPARGCCSAEQIELAELLTSKLPGHRQQQPQQQLQPHVRQPQHQHNGRSKLPRVSTRQEKRASKRQGKQAAVVHDLAPRPPSPEEGASVSKGSEQLSFASQFDPKLVSIPPTHPINRMPDLPLPSTSPITNPAAMSQPASTSTQYPLQNCSPSLSYDTLARLDEVEANRLRLGRLEERSSPSMPICVYFTTADGGTRPLKMIFDPKSQISLIRGSTALQDLGYGLPLVNLPSSKTYKVLGKHVEATHYLPLETVFPWVLEFKQLTVGDADWLGEADGVFGQPAMQRILEKDPCAQESFNQICAEASLASVPNGRRPESQAAMDNIIVQGGGTTGFQNDGSTSATYIEGAPSTAFAQFSSSAVSYIEQPLVQSSSSVGLTDAPTLPDWVFQNGDALNLTDYHYGDQPTEVVDLSTFPANTLYYYGAAGHPGQPMMSYMSFQSADTQTHYNEPTLMGMNLGMANPEFNPGC